MWLSNGMLLYSYRDRQNVHLLKQLRFLLVSLCYIPVIKRMNAQKITYKNRNQYKRVHLLTRNCLLIHNRSTASSVSYGALGVNLVTTVPSGFVSLI